MPAKIEIILQILYFLACFFFLYFSTIFKIKYFVSGLKIFAKNLVAMGLLLMYMCPLITTTDVPGDLHMFNILSSLDWVMRENVKELV